MHPSYAHSASRSGQTRRGFFSSVFRPGGLLAAVAAVEAFIGLLIEIVFIATFTQRFFAR
jgi:hypothetical protein